MSDVKRSIGQGILQQFHKYTTNRLKNINKPAMHTVTAVILCRQHLLLEVVQAEPHLSVEGDLVLLSITDNSDKPFDSS